MGASTILGYGVANTETISSQMNQRDPPEV